MRKFHQNYCNSRKIEKQEQEKKESRIETKVLFERPPINRAEKGNKKSNMSSKNVENLDLPSTPKSIFSNTNLIFIQPNFADCKESTQDF